MSDDCCHCVGRVEFLKLIASGKKMLAVGTLSSMERMACFRSEKRISHGVSDTSSRFPGRRVLVEWSRVLVQTKIPMPMTREL